MQGIPQNRGMDSSTQSNANESRLLRENICMRCWLDIFDTRMYAEMWLNNRSRVEFTVGLEDLGTSTRNGCTWCHLLKKWFDDQIRGLALPNNQARLRGTIDIQACLDSLTTPTGSFKLHVFSELQLSSEAVRVQLGLGPSPDAQDEVWSRNREGRRHLTFDIFANSSDPAAKIIPTRESQPVVHSPEAIAEVQRWIRSCADHKHCSTTIDVLLPTRVIEVLPTFSKQRSRLLVTNGLKGRYNTLSYCWGTQNTVLTRKNLAQFQREIDLSILSNTVQDAIEVTVSLGIPYLWVDAICILQDCPRDKALEISRMVSIYQSSHITIVAASAKNADEGFLLPRKASSPANTIPFMHHGFRAGTVNIRRRREVSSEETPRPPLDPVDKRAWTFQEQLLSQRLLVYSTDTLQWRCKGVVANLGSSKYEAQCDVRLPPSARAIDYVGSEPKPLFFPPPLFLAPRSTSTSYQQLLKQSRIKKLHTHWSHLVEEYSLRSMTYASDKLLALAGIAEKFGDALGTKYLAGFWEDNILEYLIWHPEKSLAKTSLYRALSWSWASLDGTFVFDSDLATRPDQDPHRQYQHYYRAYDCRILRCQITLKDDLLPYGEVTGGHIELSAVLRRAWYGDPYVGLHWLENASDFGMLSGVDPRPSCAGTSWYSGEVFCVALWIRRKIWEIVHTVKGLMLMHKENVKYERIGWFESSTENFDGTAYTDNYDYLNLLFRFQLRIDSLIA